MNDAIWCNQFGLSRNNWIQEQKYWFLHGDAKLLATTVVHMFKSDLTAYYFNHHPIFDILPPYAQDTWRSCNNVLELLELKIMHFCAFAILLI